MRKFGGAERNGSAAPSANPDAAGAPALPAAGRALSDQRMVMVWVATI